MQVGRQRIYILTATAGAILIVLAALVNAALTHYVNGPTFRRAIEKETAKGLHFSEAKFNPIRRSGLLTARSDLAIARKGRKAMTRLDARDITARFNPAGVFLRRWSIDDLKVERAEIGIQVYEPRPEPTPAKPWFSIFLPDRVYLKHVWSDHADIAWQLRGQRSGIFDTRLVITPHGRDFNYEATGGILRNPLTPELKIRQIHLLITRTLFALYDLDVSSGRVGTVHAEGKAATRGDKNPDFRFNWSNLALADWLPESTDHFKGMANGELRWTGRDYKLESATLTGAVRVNQGKVAGLSVLEQIAAVTKRPDLRTLQLTECAARIRWNQSNCRISEIEIEEKGKFRIEGEITIIDRALGGKIELGLARPYLEWLPHPEEVFPRESAGYVWTTMHLRGTVEAPQQDLSPRLVEALKESPSALIGAALREFGAWLRTR